MNRPSRLRRSWLALGLLVLGTPRLAPASSVEREAAIVARALAFERSLPERVGAGAIGIAILHKPQDAGSEQCARDWRDGFAALANVKIQDRSIALKVLPSGANGARVARDNGVHVLVVCPGLMPDLPEITRISRTQRILTVGTVPPYIEQNLTFGVFREEDKLKMVVNLRAALAEGVNFSSGMLKLARIVR